MRLFTVVLVLVFTSGIAAWSRGIDDAERCAAISDPDKRLPYCNAAIESGQLSTVNLAVTFVNRGGVYFRKGNNDRAIQDYDQAIRLNPSDGNAFNNRGSAYAAKGDYDRAIQDYNQGIRLNPSYAKAFYWRGLAKRKAGDTAGGDADIAKAKQLDPKVGQ